MMEQADSKLDYRARELPRRDSRRTHWAIWLYVCVGILALLADHLAFRYGAAIRVTSWFQRVNAIEAALWAGMAVVIGVANVRSTSEHRGIGLMMAPLLLLFGVSDIVETQTGAWWRPWWLLLWKGACVVCLFFLAFLYFRRRAAALKRRQ